MNVFVIPEDFRQDQYILRPLIQAMLKSINKKARVDICLNPLLGGIDQALKWDRIAKIIEQYRWTVDLFILCVDRDGNPNRRQVLDNLEQQATTMLSADKQFLAENAWQEIEVWVLAGHSLPSTWDWQTLRAEIHPKELYFLPFAEQRNLLNEPGQGRKTLAQEAAKQYGRIRQLCPEIKDLENRVS